MAACGAALVAGGYEAIGMGDPLGMAATVGFFAILTAPVLFVVSVIIRGLIAAWGPRELFARLTEPAGGMPRLAGWVAAVMVLTLALAWIMFQGTWQLAAWTAFKPLTVGFLEPVIAVGAVLVLMAVSRPLARLFARLATAFDRRWLRSRPERRSLLTPLPIFAIAAVLAMTAVYVLWRIVVKPRIGTVDTSIGYSPALAILAAIAIHIAWSRIGKARLAFGGGIGGLLVATVALAVVTVKTDPSLTLEIWGDRPLAGVAIERLFDLDRIRADISLSQFRPVDRPGSAHPDIVLVTIDTVRADRTPPYGGPAEMPVLKGLGDRGAVFSWAFSPSNVTRRSIPSMVIGAAATRIKGRVVGWALRVDPRHVLVAERLLAAGYETAGFMCCRGFYDPEVRTGLQRGIEHLDIEPNGRVLGKAAHEWVTAREKRPGNRPLFMWVHILEPHNWEVGQGTPHDDAEKYKLYDRSLTIADQILTEVLAGFSDRPPDQAPIVIVTADHGEALGDHGQPNHSTDLYNSQIRVPLVVAGPGIKPGHIVETVSLTDLVPTLIELAGFEAPHGPRIDGRSIADLLTGKRVGSPDAGTAFAAMIKDRSNPGGVMAIVSGRWKLIDTGGVLELYDLHADPNEQSNLYSVRTE
ncbi:hypothetical protein BH11MYX3_BH11MYX3_24730 [soil metagenome]